MQGARIPSTGKVLVTINLFGGNDLLNTVIPLHAFDRYRQLRPNIYIPRNRVLPLPGAEGDLGLNQGMTRIRDLYAANKVAIVLGAGMPQTANGLFDHEASQLNLQSGYLVGSAFSSEPTGWVGRYLDSQERGDINPGVNVSGYANLLLTGRERDAVTLSSIDSYGVQTSFDTEARMAAYDRVMMVPRPENVAERHRQLRQQARSEAQVIRERTEAYQPAVNYPDNNYVAFQLEQCARLIGAGVGARALAVAADNSYDTHAAQNDGTGDGVFGYHDSLLSNLSEAIWAFQTDMEAHGLADEVLILVISEFGRRPYENNDNGTDHGYGGAMFVIGNAVRGGVYGEYPGLDESDLVLDGNLATTVDYRSVYATILARFFDTDPVPILEGTFPTLGLL
jgi:uncharacterized protein (DUF1501 family)